MAKVTPQKPVVQKVVLGGVVFDSGRVLIVQRNDDEEILPNIWELPSGKKDPLENADDALLREIKEETDVDVEIIMPFSVFNYLIEKPGEIRDSTQINYLTKPLAKPVVKLSTEHQAFSWIKKDETDKYTLTETVKTVIKNAFDIISKLKLE